MNVPAGATATNLAQRWAESLRSGEPEPGPAWLRQLRSAAVGEFRLHGLPGNKDEAWKYTSLRRLEDLNPALGVTAPDAVAAAWKPLLSSAGGFGFRFVDGHLQWLQKEAPQGVSMLSLQDLLSAAGQDQLNHLRPLLEAVDVGGRTHAFEALNTALLRDGVIIQVAAGVDAGLCLAQWGLGACADSRLTNFRLIIILQAGARLQLLEQFQDAGQPADKTTNAAQKNSAQALNLLLQAQLAADSVLQHVRLQSAAATSVLLTFSDVHQAARSSYTCTGFDVGGGLVRHAINCRLAGDGARAEVNGAFVLDHERHVDQHICIDHLAPSCSSEQFFRGVLGGSSRGVFNGKAVIRPGADGSRVRQSSANLLLSDLAEIDTKPELEIYADEVEASHGATVGSLDEQAVFYLRSRGLGDTAARRMLTVAFCRAVTARLPDAGMAEQIAALLEAAMPKLA